MAKVKRVKIYAFWKGTVMAELEIEPRKYYKVVKKDLKKDVFVDNNIDINECISYLDHMESLYAAEYNKKGHYDIEPETMYRYMLSIQTIVGRGLRPNDNNFGVLTQKSF